MTEDRRDLRARRLLRLGSEEGPEGPEGEAARAGEVGLSPGFLERLRGRIEAAGRAPGKTVDERGMRDSSSAGGTSSGWLEALGGLARPALAMAFSVALLSGALFLLRVDRGEEDDTLETLLGGDPVLGGLLGSGEDGIWSAIGAAENDREAGGAR